MLLLLLAHIINSQVQVVLGFGRRRQLQFYCQCDRLRRAVEKVVVDMRRMTTVMAMVPRCQVDSVHILTKDSAVTGTYLCQYSSRFPWQCLFGSSNRQRSTIKQS